MHSDKHIAIKLRREGKSYNKISLMLNIPKSTLATWFSELNWSQEIKKELTRKANYIAKKRLCIINKARRESWERWREQARIQARKNFVKLKNNPLFIAGVMLYWGEGDSKIENSIVRLSNTNPQLIKMFSLFLQKTCGVPKEKIKIALILYPDLNEGKCHQFWSQVTNIPSTQFRKTQYIKGRHPTKRLTNGICMVNVSSRELKEKIFVWIEKFYKLF